MINQIDLSQITLLTFVLVFLAGVLTSFTPCIYPIVPVTVGFIGARSVGSRMRALTLSLVYVLGLAFVYSSLGLFAVLTGRLFGAVNTNPIVMIVLANFYVLLALWMLGVFSFQINLQAGEKLKETAVRRGKKDFVGSFLVGAASAFAAGPCTAPVLGALLVWIGTKQNIMQGALLMFVFSLGLGTLLVLAGTFAGFASNLPKSGAWMKAVKIFFGLVLLGAAEYFLITAGKLLF